MKEGYVIRDQEKAHFITATVVDWVDVFTRQNYRDSVVESLNYCIKDKGMTVYAYVIMSNHIHMVIQSNEGKLSDLIRDFKKFTAKMILDKIKHEPESRREWMLERFQKAIESHTRNKNYQFWQYGNHAEEVYSEKFLWSKIDYIHMNPVRSGLVKKVEDYIYSSASNYINNYGLVNVELAEIPKVDVSKESSFIKYLSQ